MRSRNESRNYLDRMQSDDKICAPNIFATNKISTTDCSNLITRRSCTCHSASILRVSFDQLCQLSGDSPVVSLDLANLISAICRSLCYLRISSTTIRADNLISQPPPPAAGNRTDSLCRSPEQWITRSCSDD